MKVKLELSLCCLLAASFAVAKDKPRVTVEVVDTQSSVRQYTYYVPGTNGRSTTNCDSNATAYDSGYTTTANGTTNCTTTTTPGTPATTGVGYIPQEHVHATLPDGRHITLWCQRGFRQCDTLEAGNYEAEIKGDTVWMYGHDLGGKEHKIKYHYVGGW
jgi:hypothetical protein